jgi:hypothetical protein
VTDLYQRYLQQLLLQELRDVTVKAPARLNDLVATFAHLADQDDIRAAVADLVATGELFTNRGSNPRDTGQNCRLWLPSIHDGQRG